MSMHRVLGFFFSLCGTFLLHAQEPLRMDFAGQLSAIGMYAHKGQSVLANGRYIPELRIKKVFKENSMLDFEVSANVYGSVQHNEERGTAWDGKIKPYRAYARYTNVKSEWRVGLQKINFGSAQIFRPLMWFDRVDPRDPLQLTDGVWAALFRYYFPNNANLWLWGLAVNKDLKGWEFLHTANGFSPEAGGRYQHPIPLGEAALSYHYRQVESLNNSFLSPEHRLGLDVRMDYEVGMWMEGSWVHLPKSMPSFRNQTMLTVGMDYTLPMGNGVGLTAEHLFFSVGDRAFSSQRQTNFSALSLNYPLTMFDSLSAFVYYNWDASNVYSFVNWQKQLNAFTFHLIGYWNPSDYVVPGQGVDNTLFAGAGVQCMVVWYH